MPRSCPSNVSTLRATNHLGEMKNRSPMHAVVPDGASLSEYKEWTSLRYKTPQVRLTARPPCRPHDTCQPPGPTSLLNPQDAVVLFCSLCGPHFRARRSRRDVPSNRQPSRHWFSEVFQSPGDFRPHPWTSVRVHHVSVVSVSVSHKYSTSQYVDQQTALAENLTYAFSDTFIIRADHTTKLSPSGSGRKSVRIQSNKKYLNHVAV